ncbi:MAG TPA: HPr kinase/phosphorylase [Caulobacteraceae bacterium]|nr:HPr kinase/phosphorylase [Caulobacteraceae bacterium]
MIRHAGLIARFERGGWRGALIEGPSGSGKSDLMLRALGEGWRLVADDRVLVWADDGRIYGRAPAPLAGLIEARGLGVLPAPGRAFAEITLAVVCAPSGEVERWPEAARLRLLDLALPQVRIVALEPSAPAKLGRALSHVGLLGQQAYQAARGGQGASARGVP